MAHQKYVVRVVRPVFQAAYLEVDAWEERDAEGRCFGYTYHIPEVDWRGSYNPDDHPLDLYCMQTRETEEGYPFSPLDFAQYAVLCTKPHQCVIPEGVQPWMRDLAYPWLLAGRMNDWISQLREARDGYHEEGIKRCEALLRTWKGTDRKVVSLQPPEDRRGDIELVEAMVACLHLLKEID